jgi:hypothetical protein
MGKPPAKQISIVVRADSQILATFNGGQNSWSKATVELIHGCRSELALAHDPSKSHGNGCRGVEPAAIARLRDGASASLPLLAA